MTSLKRDYSTRGPYDTQLRHYCYTQSQPYLDYLSSILKIFAYQASFQEDLDKSVLSVRT